MSREKSKSLLFNLTNAYGVPGHEDPVRSIFKSELAESGELNVDPLGNFYCRQSNSARPHIAIDCHMDEVGFMVQSITPDGFIKILGLGGWSASSLVSQPVVVLGSKEPIKGIYGSIPPHFKKTGGKPPTLEDLYIDLGAESREMVEDWGIRLGSAVCPDVQARESNHPDRIIGKAFDNRVGCSVCIETAQATKGSNRNLTYIASVQEEGGLRGATVAGQTVEPEMAIVLEGTPADDTPESLSENSQGILGKGVQIRCYDPTHLANPRLVDWTVSLAKEAGIPFQLAVRRSGGTNAGRYHLAHKGVPTVVLGVPSRYIHSHLSMIDLKDYEATCALTKLLTERFDGEALKSVLPS
jgi:putative aminopeptidase FrvX